jgi:chitooligosaccharide deacetylase
VSARHWLLARTTGRLPIAIAARWSRGGALCQGDARQPVFALTFDDGPDPRWTPAILDALAAHRAHATFFCTGAAAERHPDLVRRAAAAGHDIGTHLWSHQRDTVERHDLFQDELARSTALLASLAGRPVRHLRFPYGHRGRQRVAVLARQGLRAVHWTVSGHDSREADPAAIVARVGAALRPGAIVLLHDAIADEERIAPPYLRTRDATVAALPGLLSLAGTRGLRAVSVAQMLDGAGTRVSLAPG